MAAINFLLSMLFIRNCRFWNTEYSVWILKKFESSLPTQSWTESAVIIFTTEVFSSAQSNVTSHNVSFVYQQKHKENFECLKSCSSPAPSPTSSRNILNFKIAMFWLSVGIFWNYYRCHHFRTHRTFSVVVTPSYPSSFLWLQSE